MACVDLRRWVRIDRATSSQGRAPPGAGARATDRAAARGGWRERSRAEATWERAEKDSGVQTFTGGGCENTEYSNMTVLSNYWDTCCFIHGSARDTCAHGNPHRVVLLCKISLKHPNIDRTFCFSPAQDHVTSKAHTRTRAWMTPCHEASGAERFMSVCTLESQEFSQRYDLLMPAAPSIPGMRTRPLTRVSPSRRTEESLREFLLESRTRSSAPSSKRTY